MDIYERLGLSRDSMEVSAFPHDAGDHLPDIPGRPWLNDLNREQREAATARRHICVIAGAGTGKTKALTAAIQDRVVGDRTPADSIMVVTFTRKAANEMRERLEAVQCPVPRYLGTFHSVCIRLMRDFPELNLGRGSRCQFLDDQAVLIMIRDVLLPSMPEEFLQRVADIHCGGDVHDLFAHDVVAGVRDIISSMKAEQIVPDDLLAEDFRPEAQPYHLRDKMMEDSPAWDIARFCYRFYETEMARLNALDYDDIINIPLRALEKSVALRRVVQQRIKTVLVDEYQDCSLGQKRLAEIIAGDEGSLFVVGDDGQSVYGWRGAHVDFIRAWAETPGVSRITLLKNYRSTNGILNMGRVFLSYDGDVIDKKLVAVGPYAADTEAPKIFCFPDAKIEFAAIAANIARRIVDGESMKSIAVLVRSRRLARRAMNALIRKGVPAQMDNGSLWDKKEIRFLIAASLLIIDEDNPANVLRFKDLFSSGILKMGVGEVALKRLMDHASRDGVSVALDALADKNKKTTEIIGILRHIQAIRREPGGIEPSAVIEALYSRSGMSALLRNKQTDLRERLAVTNWHQAGKIHEEITTIQNQINDVDELIALAGTYSSLEELVSTGVMGRDSKAESNAVLITTIHGAKGLEWDTVYIAGFSDRNMQMVEGHADPSSPGYKETCRTAYVAATRARRNLIITWASEYTPAGPRGYTPHRPCPLIGGMAFLPGHTMPE